MSHKITSKTNTFGLSGVRRYWFDRSKFVGRFVYQGKLIWCGVYSTPVEASAAVQRWKKIIAGPRDGFTYNEAK